MKTTAISCKTILTEAVNLRRDLHDKEVWRPAGTPVKVSGSNLIEFTRLEPFGDGRVALLSLGQKSGTEGYPIYCQVLTDGQPTEGSAGVLKQIGILPGEPILAESDSPGVIRLLLKHLPDQYLTYDLQLNFVFCGAMPQLPDILFSAGETNTLYQTVGATELSGNSTGSSGGSLNAEDEKTLTDNLTAAYELLRNRCSSMNYALQPVVMRYRLLDAAGNTVALGPTVFVGIPDGFTAADGIVLNSTDSLATLGSATMQATVFRPCLTVPQALPAPWNRLVSKLVVEMSAEIDPLDRKLTAGYGMRLHTDSGMVTITACLPGFSRGTVADTARLRNLVRAASVGPMTTVAEYTLPFGGGMGSPGTRIAVTLPSSTAHYQAQAKISATLPATRRSYSAALKEGDLTVLCNPLHEPFGGWSPLNFVTSYDNGAASGSWKLAFSVKLATPAGERWQMTEATGTGGCPATFNPLLSYPSDEATELTISLLHPSGTVYRQSFQLTVDPATGIARHVAKGARRISLTTTAAQYKPSASTLAPQMQNGVAEVFTTSDLHTPTSRATVMPGEITALRTAPRSQSSWDFSRRKLLFFGTPGTYLATLNGSGEFHAIAPVDRRPVKSGAAVCDATGDSGATLRVIAGEDIVEVNGQKVNTLHNFAGTSLSPVALGWSEPFKELWILGAGGELKRLTAGGELIAAEFSDIASPSRLTNTPDGLILASASGSYLLDREESSSPVAIRLKERFLPSGRANRLILNSFASSLTGSFTLAGDRGSEIPEQLIKLTFTGACNSAIPLRLSTLRRWLTASYDFTAARDLAIHPLTLK